MILSTNGFYNNSICVISEYFYNEYGNLIIIFLVSKTITVFLCVILVQVFFFFIIPGELNARVDVTYSYGVLSDHLRACITVHRVILLNTYCIKIVEIP